MFVINLFGGPGTGKSTLAAGIFQVLKMQGYSVELATEYAKDCVYENRLDVLTKDQLYVFAKQNHKLVNFLNYSTKLDFVVTDSPILLSNIYGKMNNCITETFEKFVLETFNGYDNLNFKLSSNFEYEGDGRVQTEAEANEIDLKVTNYLNDNNIKYENILLDHVNVKAPYEYVNRVLLTVQMVRAKESLKKD